MSFWDVIWFIFISYAFFAYLMMLFSIVADLFRDPDLSGFAKAVWLIALLFLPFLAALVYVIVRGRDMAVRSAGGRAAAQKRHDDNVKEVAGAATPAGQIAQAQTMLTDGTISQSEFDTLKAKALAV